MVIAIAWWLCSIRLLRTRRCFDRNDLFCFSVLRFENLVLGKGGNGMQHSDATLHLYCYVLAILSQSPLPPWVCRKRRGCVNLNLRIRPPNPKESYLERSLA